VRQILFIENCDLPKQDVEGSNPFTRSTNKSATSSLNGFHDLL
jgi:hypothetical protein